MPNRIIRDGILTSERVNALSPNAELFYRRLLSVVDDFGRFTAQPTLLRASCYPLKLDSVKEDSISKHLAECVDARLIVLYTVTGKAFLELQDFRQQVRAKVSKYPSPDVHMRSKCVANDKHALANAHLDGDGDGDGDGKALGLTPIRVGASAEHDERGGFDAIIETYTQTLPACKQVGVLNPKRKRRLAVARKLAKQICKTQGWEYNEREFFGAYWAECSKDAWMRGEVANPNNPSWKQNIDVLLAEDRFADVMDRVLESMKRSAQ